MGNGNQASTIAAPSGGAQQLNVTDNQTRTPALPSSSASPSSPYADDVYGDGGQTVARAVEAAHVAREERRRARGHGGRYPPSSSSSSSIFEGSRVPGDIVLRIGDETESENEADLR